VGASVYQDYNKVTFIEIPCVVRSLHTYEECWKIHRGIRSLSAHSCIKVVPAKNLVANVWKPRMQEHRIPDDMYVLPVHV
jgi:hypothetical protein